MRGVLATGDADRKELVERARQSPSMTGLDLATRVTTPSAIRWDKPVLPVLALRSDRSRRPSRAAMWWRTITASSATSCGAWSRWARA